MKTYIIKKGDSEYYDIPLIDIIYIESNNKNIIIHTTNRKIKYYQKIGDMTDKIGISFFRCHRCYIVNMEHVIGYNASAVILRSGDEIPLSRRRKKSFANKFIEYRKNFDVA